MVAIFTGSLSGFGRGSGAMLGASGMLGSSAMGRGADKLLLNAANGNLIVDRSDEVLIGRGPDAEVSFTYNSLNAAANAWSMGVYRVLFGLSGTANTAGSTISRTDRDMHVRVYTYDGQRNAYVNNEGTGAHDEIRYANGVWSWSDTDSGVTETYTSLAASPSYLYVSTVSDRDGNTQTYGYDANANLSSITNANGDQTVFTNVNGKPTEVITYFSSVKGTKRSWSALTRVRYAWDAQGRMTNATIDLSPDDRSTADGKVYSTSYGYDGASTRIAWISQSDGSFLSVTYDASGRVATMTETISGGVSRTTTIGYGVGYTTVTDATGQVVRLDYLADGSLHKITAPPASSGAAAQVMTFGYTNGDVSTVIDAAGHVTSHTYDGRGNRLSSTDRLGNVTTWTYGANDLVLTETRSGSNSASGNAQHTGRFVYDPEGHLRYTISAEGRVTEHRYNWYGDLELTIDYPEHHYDVSALAPTTALSEAQLDAWRNALADRSSTRITANYYNGRGQITSSIAYAIATSWGDPSTAEGYSRTYFSYDQAGLLRTRQREGEVSESYIYDGLGRLTASYDVNGGTTSVVFNDALTQTIVTMANGLVETSTYDKVGNLIAFSQSGSHVAGGTATQKFDKLGRLRVSTDATGFSTYYVYDKTGRMIAEVSHQGWLTEYRYDSNGRVIGTVRYANTVSQTNLAALADPDSNMEMAWLRPVLHAWDICHWQIYDAGGRLISTIDGSGAVATFEYDSSGRLVKTLHYFNKLSSSTVAGFKTAPPTATVLPPLDGRDSVARNFYDKDGKIIAVLDGEGYLTRSLYDRAGQKVEDVAYLNATHSAYRATGTLDQLLATQSPHPDDRRVRYSYDGRGFLRYRVDGFNQVTELAYDSAGRPTTTIAYAGSIAATSDYSFDNVKYLVGAAGLPSSPATRRSWTVYDSAGRAAYTVDSEDAVTQFSYDAMGQLTKTVQFAARRPTTALPSEYDMYMWANGQTGASENRVNRYFYSARGELRFTVDAEGFVNRSDFDSAGRVVREIRWDSAISLWDGATIDNVNAMTTGGWSDTRYAYNAGGELTDVWNGENNHVRYAYYANGELASKIVGDADPATTYFEYDAAGRLAAQYEAYGTAEQAVVHYVYDGHGNAVSVTDPRSHVTNRTFDRMGRVLTETDALGGVVRYEYNAFGDVAKTTDARGHSSYNYYDRLGRTIVHRDAEDFVTESSYNAFGEMIAVTRRYNRAANSAGVAALPAVVGHVKDATTLFEVDRLGRVTKATDAEGHYEQYTLDAFGNRISVRNKVGGIVTNAYDRRGLLVAETLPIASVNDSGGVVAYTVTNRFEYDSGGKRTKSIEAFGLPEQRTTTFIYDKADRLVETRGDAVTVTSQADHFSVSTAVPTERLVYDERGRVIETIDALGARALTYYDKLGRKTVEIGATGSYATYSYDKNGNVTATRTYAAAVALPAYAGGAAPAAPGGEYRETTFTYDALNRLKTSSVANIRTGAWNGSFYATSVTTLTNSFDHDANGNVIKATDNRGATVYTYYDRADRAYASIDQEDYLTTWTRDAEGNILSERRHAQRASYPNALWPTYVPTDPADRVTSFNYDRNGRRLSETRENVVHSSTAGANQISTGTANATVSYAYNGLGQVTRKTEATGEFIDYSYDVTGRLLTETRAGFYDHAGNYVRPALRYSYNGIDQLTRTSQGSEYAGAGDRVARYVYGAGGRLTYFIDAAGTTYEYCYDAAGNTVRESWNRVKSDGSSMTDGLLYSRDILGRVTAQGLATWTGGGWARGDTQETAYNAFGEVSQRGVNGGWQEQFAYDGAGRLWRTNAEDGVWRYFVHDAGGNRTLTLESEGSPLAGLTFDHVLGIATGWGAHSVGGAYVDGINSTIAIFDRRGQQVQLREPHRQLSASNVQSLVRNTTYNAFGEVVSESDARGATTDYVYNALGRLVQKTSPLVAYTAENGAVAHARPTEHQYYDLSGRLIGSRDGNGNLSTLTLLAGTGYGGTEASATAEYHADGGVVRTYFDVFGDARIIRDALGRDELLVYDAKSRLIQQTRRSGLVEHFAYDCLGQRIQHWNNMLQVPVYGPEEPVWIEQGYYDDYGNWIDTSYWGTHTPIIGYTPDKQLTDYDLQGRVTRQVAFGGDVTTTSYAWNGALATAGMGTFGGWTETTTYANGRTLTEQSDVHGRILSKTDLGGHVFAYTYDLAGRISQRTGGETITYLQLNTGRTGQVSGFTGDLAGEFSRKTTNYGYDANGNLASEAFVMDGQTDYGWYDEWGTYHPDLQPWSRIYKNATASYDSLNRIVAWSDTGSANMPGASVAWEYDLASNIRRSRAEHHTLDQNGTPSPHVTVQDNWYRYDALNRVVTKGLLSGGQILRGTGGFDHLYNAASERVSTTRSVQRTGSIINPDYYPDPYYGYGGDPYISVWYEADAREDYTYDPGGTLATVRISEGALVDNGDGTYYVTTPDSYAALKSTHTHDQMGRLTRQIDWLADGSNAAYDRTITYNEKGQISSEYVVSKQGWNTIQSWITNNFGSGASYALGAVVSTYTANHRNGAWQSASNSTTHYAWYDGAVQSQISLQPNTNSGATQNSYFGYDGSGVLTSVSIYDGRTRNVTIVSDSHGHAIRRDESDYVWNQGDPHEIWFRFGGKQLGYTGNNGTLDTDYQTSIDNRTRAPGNGAFRFGHTWGTSHSDFDLSGEAITSYGQGSSGGSYTVRAGDSLSSIAASLWGDSSLWYKLAEANGMAASNALVEGQRLTLPAGVLKSQHNAGTLKPYDPGEAMGEVGPTTPQPQQATARRGGRCGIFGQILLVVIAVAVSVFTYGALSGAMSPILAGAISGAAGSVASQTFGVVTGIQDKFDWKGVAMAALGGAVGPALGKIGGSFGKFLNANKLLSQVAKGALASGITQGIGVATGLQSKFSWASVAAAGVAAGVSGAIGRELKAEPLSMNNSLLNHGRNALASGAGSIAAAATRSLIEGSSFGDNVIAALPSIIGSTLGNMIGFGVSLAGKAPPPPPPPTTSSNGSRNGVMFLKAGFQDDDKKKGPKIDGVQLPPVVKEGGIEVWEFDKQPPETDFYKAYMARYNTLGGEAYNIQRDDVIASLWASIFPGRELPCYEGRVYCGPIVEDTEVLTVDSSIFGGIGFGMFWGANRIPGNLGSGNFVRYFGQGDVTWYTKPGGTFGTRGGEIFALREWPGINIRSHSDAVRYSGNAGKVTEAYLARERIFGYRTPISGLQYRMPTLADSAGNLNWLEGGDTAVSTPLGSERGYLRNRGAAEFMVRGGEPATRPGSTLFELVDGREEVIFQTRHNTWSNLTPRQARVLTGVRITGKGFGIVGTGYGLYQDGTSIYDTYQADKLTGNYSNTRWEVARTGAGWGGAAAGGAVGAKIGAGIGAFGGPIGAGIGGVVGGIVGGGSGYWYGSSTVQNMRSTPSTGNVRSVPQMPTISCTAGNQPQLPPGQRYFTPQRR